MTMIMDVASFIMNLDESLYDVVQNYGLWTYLLLFLIVFCETGLVVTPFLPGDSLLFASGALAAMGSLEAAAFFTVFFTAAVIGDLVNYLIGQKIGTGILEKEKSRFVKKEYILQAQDFYERYGSLTIVLGRFTPVIRTFVPFVAGMGKMNPVKFITYNILGGFLWVSLFLGGGYFFGNLPIIKDNFSMVLFAIIAISIVPGVAAFLKERKNMKMIKVHE